MEDVTYFEIFVQIVDGIKQQFIARTRVVKTGWLDPLGLTHPLNRPVQPDSLIVYSSKKWLGPTHHGLWVKQVGPPTHLKLKKSIKKQNMIFLENKFE